MDKRFSVGVANSFPSLSAAYVSHIVKKMSLVVYCGNFYIKKAVGLNTHRVLIWLRNFCWHMSDLPAADRYNIDLCC